jgi:predicted naringenin-chalcone synthase
MDVYDTNEALINLGTSRESSSTISNNSLNHVDAKLQKHGNENSKQTLSVMHDLLEDEERFEKMLFVCR